VVAGCSTAYLYVRAGVTADVLMAVKGKKWAKVWDILEVVRLTPAAKKRASMSPDVDLQGPYPEIDGDDDDFQVDTVHASKGAKTKSQQAAKKAKAKVFEKGVRWRTRIPHNLF
jgi:hypothetical protein